ncbi:hypothetical protein DVA86_16500 [Streptomyces armeniacus]|uniref:Sensor domain-containing protein n=1 Tax=Streptomyces armeniacus TaxID=83291 RepID=A0A345XQV4_9ACTN|nr:hypothetical protein [Streptomyces armeniacus]AXK34020.1 hypothetical protein DVA86_16500 [Streptomyces armeniacus]
MPSRSIRIAAATAAAAAVAGAGLFTAGQSAAAEPSATAPGFLEPAELPPHPSSSWQAGDVSTGLPDPRPFCLDDAMPSGDRTWHRTYSTDLDTGATQVSVSLGSEQKAAKLAAKLRKGYTNCTDEWLADYPEGTASWKDYGKVDAQDGAQVYGTYTALPESSHNVHLFGVGRDGATVTVVSWGQIGTLEDAPVADFKDTVRTAVNKL